MIDFAALPPETNSARMYSGPGSGPLLAAGAAWNSMAAEMRSAAASYDAVLTELTSASWFGPSSILMSAAAVPYVEWLSTTATQAEQAGSQANAAASAYESAYAMTVPPAVIAANRAQLATLVATNVFGQNTPAIAATEAQYAEMWAQDAAAMNGYASASDVASALTPFTAPQSPTSAAGVADQANAVAQAAETPAGTAQSILSANPIAWLEGLLSTGSDPSSPFSGVASVLNGSSGSALGSFINSNFFSTAVVNGALAGGPFNPQFILQTVAGFSFLAGSQGALGAGSAASGPTRCRGRRGGIGGIRGRTGPERSRIGRHGPCHPGRGLVDTARLGLCRKYQSRRRAVGGHRPQRHRVKRRRRPGRRCRADDGYGQAHPPGHSQIWVPPCRDATPAGRRIRDLRYSHDRFRGVTAGDQLGQDVLRSGIGADAGRRRGLEHDGR